MTVFITRPQTRSSLFSQLLQQAGHTVVGESLLQFTPVAFAVPEAYDWVFGYSPRAITYFLEGLDRQRASVPDSVRWAVLGPGTARALPAGLQPTYCGNGQPTDVAIQLAPLVARQRVLFPQARHSRQSVQRLLPDTVQKISLIVYDNSPNQMVQVPAADVLVFTSPLNVQSYLKQREIPDAQPIVAIGSTTATALTQAGIDRYTIAAEPTEQAMAAAVLQLLGR